MIRDTATVTIIPQGSGFLSGLDAQSHVQFTVIEVGAAESAIDTLSALRAAELNSRRGVDPGVPRQTSTATATETVEQGRNSTRWT